MSLTQLLTPASLDQNLSMLRDELDGHDGQMTLPARALWVEVAEAHPEEFTVSRFIYKGEPFAIIEAKTEACDAQEFYELEPGLWANDAGDLADWRDAPDAYAYAPEPQFT